MDIKKLDELSVNVLFEKFGAGSHKPGSGSAAALQGMLSAQLTRTVIDLTLNKNNYQKWWPKFKQIDSEIQNAIYPALIRLFQEDSELFHRVITLRNERDTENNPAKREIVLKELDRTLKEATKLPLEMLKHCIKISEFAILIFENGFKSARGDSGVALNTAISAIAGCLSIINLNLLSLERDDWTDNLRKELILLKEEYHTLSFSSLECLKILEQEVEEERLFKEEIEKLKSNFWVNSPLTNESIEEMANKFQIALWKHRRRIWKNEMIDNPIHVLQPAVVLKRILNYKFDRQETLGVHEVEGELLEIAGFIDKKARMVAVSKSFSIETQNFTAAHELGHALMHEQAFLHRDRPLDGSLSKKLRDVKELQADKFAACFLMPKKYLKTLFQELFLTEKFIINRDTAFGLREYDVIAFKSKCKDSRGLSRILAKSEFYRNNSFKSLAETFQVSIETMAIRLEELGLVDIF